MGDRTRQALPILGLVAVTACGGGGGSPTVTPTPTPTPTPLPPVVVAQRTGFALQARYIGWLPFPTSRAGQLDATVDWTSAANNLNVYLVKGECTYDQLDAGQCEVLAASEGNAKPETLRYQSATASSYTIFIHNLGPGDESISFQVVLSASLTAGAPSATVAAAAPVPELAQLASARVQSAPFRERP